MLFNNSTSSLKSFVSRKDIFSDSKKGSFVFDFKSDKEEVNEWLENLANSVKNSQSQRVETDKVLLDEFAKEIFQEFEELYKESSTILKSINIEERVLKNLSYVDREYTQRIDNTSRLIIEQFKRSIINFKKEVLEKSNIISKKDDNIYLSDQKIEDEFSELFKDTEFNKQNKIYINSFNKTNITFRKYLSKKYTDIYKRSEKYMSPLEKQMIKLNEQYKKTINPFKKMSISIQMDVLLIRRKLSRDKFQRKQFRRKFIRRLAYTQIGKLFNGERRRKALQRLNRINLYKKTSRENHKTIIQQELKKMISEESNSNVEHEQVTEINQPFLNTSQFIADIDVENEELFNYQYTNLQKKIQKHFFNFSDRLDDIYETIFNYTKTLEDGFFSAREEYDQKPTKYNQKSKKSEFSSFNLGSIFSSFVLLLGVGFLAKTIIPKMSLIFGRHKKTLKDLSVSENSTVTFPEVNHLSDSITLGNNNTDSSNIDIQEKIEESKKLANILYDKINFLDSSLNKNVEEFGRGLTDLEYDSIKSINIAHERLNQLAEELTASDERDDKNIKKEIADELTNKKNNINKSAREEIVSSNEGDGDAEAKNAFLTSFQKGASKIDDDGIKKITDTKSDTDLGEKIEKKISESRSNDSKFKIAVSNINNLINELYFTADKKGVFTKEKIDLFFRNKDSVVKDLLNALTKFKSDLDEFVKKDIREDSTIEINSKDIKKNNLINEFGKSLARSESILRKEFLSDVPLGFSMIDKPGIFVEKISEFSRLVDNFYNFDNLGETEKKLMQSFSVVIDRFSLDKLLTSIDEISENFNFSLDENNEAGTNLNKLKEAINGK